MYFLGVDELVGVNRLDAIRILNSTHKNDIDKSTPKKKVGLRKYQAEYFKSHEKVWEGFKSLRKIK